MTESFGNLWNHHARSIPICITTNGTVRGDGACVMGAGIAAQARCRFNGLEYRLGRNIQLHGLNVCFLEAENLIAFPVKHRWHQMADLELIELSGHQLVDLVAIKGWSHVCLPRPGCGNGQLKWENVKPALYMLDDRFEVVERKR